MNSRFDWTWKRHTMNLSMLHYKRRFQYAASLLLVAALWAAMSNLDYQEEARQAHELAERRANQLGECVQGKLRMTHDNDTGRGYGKTAIVCKKAEEIEV